jgi:cation diffusion facilitator CzcD-associated flavoprotein CzcO
MTDAPSLGHLPVVVIGAGFAGIGAAAVLTQAGHEVLVLERAATVGGTWRDNSYPGCACDVQSHLYAFSFAPNPAWSHVYSTQPEILAYLKDVVRRFDLGRRIRCGVGVDAAVWDEQTLVWRLGTTAGTLTADVLISACGPLSEPKVPAFPGLESFGGQLLHSARWTPDVDLAGRRVAVVGTGASAIQIVPQLAGSAAELTVFQRTAPWVTPRRDREIPPRRRRRYALHPAAQRLTRWAIYGGRELLVLGMVHRPGLMHGVERLGRAQLRRQVPDPGLRALLTPTYRAGCKRILSSDDYYPALARENVELIPSGVARFEPGAVVAEDGTRREADAVVLATGFATTDLPIAHHLSGRGGRPLADAWRETGMQALRGTTVHGFPNLFLLVGPNTGLGHTSMIHVIESQLRYVREALAVMRDRGIAAIEPAADAQRRWNAALQERMRGTVWATGGCASWYQDEHGRITTLWPGSTARLRWETRRIDLAEYLVTPPPPRGATASTAAAGSTASTALVTPTLEVTR